MSSRLTTSYLELMERVKTIKSGTKPVYKYFNVWDEQIPELISGKGYTFNSPACFFEIELGTPRTLGAKVTSYPNCIVRIRIGEILLDARSNKMERNVEIFESKDKIVETFLKQSPTFMSTFQLIEDKQDFSHDNYYQYIVGFSTHFTEVKGTIFDDPNLGKIQTIKVNLIQTYVDQFGVHYGNGIVDYINASR